MRPLRPLRTQADAPPEASSDATVARLRREAARRRSGLKRRSVGVRALRVLAPLSMAVIAAILVGWIVGRAHKRDRSPTTATAVSIHMSNPRFLGQDARGRAFVLVGSEAVRDDKDPHLIHLTSPRLSLDTAPGVAFVVTARTGLYRDDTHKLTLDGDVVVDDGKGGRFYSDQGEVDTDSGDVVGRKHARSEGPQGVISGDGYALSGKGDHATFGGRVISRFYMKGAPAPSAPSAAAKEP